MSDLKTNQNDKKCYQEVDLKSFERATCNVREQYLSSVTNICTNVEERFSYIKKPSNLQKH